MSDSSLAPTEPFALLTELGPEAQKALPPEVRLRRSFAARGTTVAPSEEQLRPMIATLMGIGTAQLLPGGGELELSLIPVHIDSAGVAERRGVKEGMHLRLSLRAVPVAPDPDDRILVCAPPAKLREQQLQTMETSLQSCGGSLRVDALGESLMVVHLYLPVVSAAPEDDSATHGCGTILFVDDEAAILKVHRRSMESLGYEVLDCAEGRAALRIALEAGDRLDLVLTDRSMPDISGDALAREIRQRWPNLPIVLSTGFAVDEAGYETFDAVLSKPFTLEDLSRVLARAKSRKAEGASE